MQLQIPLLLSCLAKVLSSPPRGVGASARQHTGQVAVRLGISLTPRPGTVAGRGVELVVEGGLLVNVVSFGVDALSAVAGRF